MIFGEVNAFLALFERAVKFVSRARTRHSETVADRFVRIFESHGVHRTQIPRFFGHGITLSAVENPERLTIQLTEEALQSACDLFAINREWLDGRNVAVHPVHDFYKYPERYESFIDSLLMQGKEVNLGSLDGVVLAPSTNSNQEAGLLILEQPIGILEKRLIWRFHLIECSSYSYWKTRGYLAAMCAASWRRGIYVRGRTLPSSEIEDMASGNEMLGWGGEGLNFIGALPYWYPEDLALLPSEYLRGVDPERDGYGCRAALGLWLELNEKGAMVTGVEKGGEKAAFETALENLNN